MSYIVVDESSGWTVLSEEGNELIVNHNNIDEAVIKVRVAKFLGERQDLLNIFKSRVASDATIHSYCNEKNLFGEWYCDSYVSQAQNTIYSSFYYKILDKHYVVIEMSTESLKDAGKLRSLITSLIGGLDLQLDDEKNVLRCGDTELILDTPQTFRFSKSSTEDRLIFLGENKYLFVGLDDGSELIDLVQKSVKSAHCGSDECSTEVVANEDGTVLWARYEVEGARGAKNFGTYFKQKVKGCWVLSFLMEIGESSVDVEKVLSFGEVQDEFTETAISQAI